VVIAVLVVPEKVRDPKYLNYLGHPSFRSGKQFLEYVEELQERSVYEIPVEINENDALLTLSTCYEDERLLVVGRRIRPEESLPDVMERIWEAQEK
jgi:sortase B